MQNIIPHSISLAEAKALTTKYRENIPADMPLCETFDKASVIKMLDAPTAEKLRIYYGRKDNGQVCAVLVTADANDRDILPAINSEINDDDDELILEDSIRCPEACPPPSPLNNG